MACSPRCSSAAAYEIFGLINLLYSSTMLEGEKTGHASNRLERRMERILRTVVELFVATGTPVGSRTLSKAQDEHLSPASIRNTMSDLEEMGFLSQPHASAGRMPTDKGYRYFVDVLMGKPSLPARIKAQIDRFFCDERAGIGSILEHTPRLLSRVSHYVGIVSVPQLESTVFRHIEFIRQAKRLVQVIFISHSGIVHKKLMEVEEDCTQEELDRIGNWVAGNFQGMTLVQVRERVKEMLLEERARVDQLMRRSLKLSEASFSESFGEDDIYVEGAANIIMEPDFADPEIIRLLISAIEDKKLLLKLINHCIGGPGVQIAIGSETEMFVVPGCSIIASTYCLPDGSSGTVALLGPTRMPYPRTIFLVDYISRRISDFDN